MNSTIKDVMSTHVIAVRPGAGYKEMAAMLREQRVSAFPVIDADNKVIGVVSEADLLTKEALEGTVPRTMQSLMRQHVRTQVNALTAVDLMTKPPVTIGPSEPVSHATRLMYCRKVKRLPVVDDDGRLLGIVSRADVLSVFSRSDASIRHGVIDEVIAGTARTDPARFTVAVKDGIVTVEGEPENAGAGHSMIDEIRHVEGVVAVRDRLSYPLNGSAVPVSGPQF
jgi:CBS domain-containing protein